MSNDQFMSLALRLARRGFGATSPNPMVGAVLVKRGKIIGRGWHHRAGLPHAEIEALSDAKKRGHSPIGAELYVTLEPCSTHGRTPPCTTAIIGAGIKRVIVGTADPNPNHAGQGLKILKDAGLKVTLKDAAECANLNESFNHWIVHRTPFVIVKAGMTLDGKIATASGESKWITSESARQFAMTLRRAADAILVGVNTILSDNPSLTIHGRDRASALSPPVQRTELKTPTSPVPKQLRRIVLDSLARTPLDSKVVSDEFAASTTIVVSHHAPKARTAALAKRVNILIAPATKSKINLRWLLKKLGSENVTNLLIEGGGEVNASFLAEDLAQRVAFFYAPKVLGGRNSRKSVAGEGAQSTREIINLQDIEWRKIGPDLFLTARIRAR